MFQDSAQSFDAATTLTASADGQSGPPARVTLPVSPVATAGRYGSGKGINLPAAIVVALVHVAIIGVIIQARTIYVQKKQEALSVVNLTPPSPPPPADEAPPPPDAPVVAPPPIVVVPAPPSPVIAAPEAPPAVPVPVAAVATPVSFAPPAAPSVVQANDLMARMVAGKPPRYPIESRRKHEEGTVVLSLVLGLDGSVQSISIARSSGVERLDKAALQAVRDWRWQPMMRNGAPVQVKGLVEIPFILKA